MPATSRQENLSTSHPPDDQKKYQNRYEAEKSFQLGRIFSCADNLTLKRSNRAHENKFLLKTQGELV